MSRDTQFVEKNVKEYKFDPKTVGTFPPKTWPAWLTSLWNMLSAYLRNRNITLGGLKVSNLSVNNDMEYGKNNRTIYTDANGVRRKVYLDKYGVWITEIIDE